MGKRELLIIIAFLVVGAVAYQATAPPPKPGEKRFSLRSVFSNIKNEISANNASATVNKTGTITVRPDVTEVRITASRGVPLTIVGEDRHDIAYEFPVDSTGPDEATARSYAEKSKILEDDLGSVLGLSTFFPKEGTQNAQLTLHVPAKLMVRIESSGTIQVRDLSALDLRNLAGEVTISNVGAVLGSHRSGELNITGAGKVELTLSSSRAKIRDVATTVQINARNGECAITNGAGSVTATVANVELTIAGYENGTVTVGGEGGQAALSGIRAPLTVDVRRMMVELEVAGGPTQAMSIITTDEPIRLTLAHDTNIAIDAVAAGGEIKAEELGWSPAKDDRAEKLTTTMGQGGARALLRNSRGDIVITRRK